MNIHFKDFRPIKSGQQKVLFMTVSNYEAISEVLPEMNDWIERNNIDVINIETLVLPNIDFEEGSNDSHLRTSGEMSSAWFQIIRIWFKLEKGQPMPVS